MTRTVFDDEEVARAYADSLRRRSRGRNRMLAGFTYAEWETPPTAGDASYWMDHTDLVFVRGNSVVILGAAENDRAQLVSRRALIQDLAHKVDAKLVGEMFADPNATR